MLVSAPPAVSSARSRARVAGSASRARSESVPPACAQLGMTASSPVPLAGYGYWSAVTSTPRARAASMAATACGILPQLGRPDALR
jgi:hypothetical protein